MSVNGLCNPAKKRQGDGFTDGNGLWETDFVNERYQPQGKPRAPSSDASGGVLNPKGNKKDGFSI
jgi:hypothetical protein